MTQQEWSLVQEMPVYNDGETFGGYKIKNQWERWYELGYVNSELTLRLIFKKIDGKWFVVDGGDWGWYPGMDMSAEKLAETIKEVQRVNAEFIKQHP